MWKWCKVFFPACAPASRGKYPRSDVPFCYFNVARICQSGKPVLLLLLALTSWTMEGLGTKCVLISLMIATFCMIVNARYNLDLVMEREHKSKWCKGTPFNQTISRKNCKSQQVLNKMCYGECLSYYLPGKEHDEVACFACQPSKQETKAIFLNCFEGNKENIKVAFIQIIKECRCMLIDLKSSDIKNWPLWISQLWISLPICKKLVFVCRNNHPWRGIIINLSMHYCINDLPWTGISFSSNI